MTQLSQPAFDKAAEFIATRARPLELSQFDYHFVSGSVQNVLVELKKFQNDDGGFGHGVESDVCMPFSSPIVSSVAFQILRELGVPGDHDIVRDGSAYFERTYNRSIGGWEQVSQECNDFARAPWWDYKPVPQGEQLDPLSRSNPGPEIVGYLRLYADLADACFVEEVTSGILDTFDKLPDDMAEHSTFCFIRLAEMSPGPVADRLVPKLRRGVHLTVGKSAEDWQGYGGRPLWYAGTPESLFADELTDEIQRELDFLVDTQTDDGSWQPSWTWDGQYETEWNAAKVEWSGWLTLRNLLSLRAWDRI